MNLTTLQQLWLDTPQSHAHTHEMFVELVNKDEQLCAHRDFVEKNAFGFGERSFQWLWNILVQEMPSDFSFLEVGVFRFQIVSLVRLLADRQGKSVQRYCVTPLSSIGIGWESDYAADGERIHDEFGLEKDYVIYKGLSNDRGVVMLSNETSPYDMVYIDGAHDFETCLFDLLTYSILVKTGGYLIIDDCNCDMNFPATGFFTGIDTVTSAKLKWLDAEGHGWDFVCSVVHISVYRRK